MINIACIIYVSLTNVNEIAQRRIEQDFEIDETSRAS